MSKRIYNFETELVFKEKNNEDINRNVLGVFPYEKITNFFIFRKMMPVKKYQTLISNTDRSDESSTQWWSILNISPKIELLLFDSFWISLMKHFVISDDKKKC